MINMCNEDKSSMLSQTSLFSKGKNGPYSPKLIDRLRGLIIKE